MKLDRSAGRLLGASSVRKLGKVEPSPSAQDPGEAVAALAEGIEVLARTGNLLPSLVMRTYLGEALGAAGRQAERFAIWTTGRCVRAARNPS
jgi:hypothetical protein